VILLSCSNNGEPNTYPIPKVTIGICVRNSQNLIRDAFNSIVSQNFPHTLIEIIFVDDGSTDRTLSIIKKCSQQTSVKTKIFHHQWKGLGYSRNVVVNEAIGEFIFWVDADMLLPKDSLLKSIIFMEKNPAVGIGKAKLLMYPHNSIIGFLENSGYIAAIRKFGNRATSRALGTGGSIYRTSAIRHVGGFNNSLIGAGEDVDAEYRIRAAGWITFLGTPASFYERPRQSLKELWKEGVWHGFGGYLMRNKENVDLYVLLKLNPVTGFLVGVWYSKFAYKLLHKKLVFLLPFEYTFKRIAWCYGFLKGQLS
jgi:glycosyltransferase involved in cell wall biosynthesis